MSIGRSVEVAGILRFYVVLTLNTKNFVEWPIKDGYLVNISVFVDGAERLTMAQLSASNGMDEKLRQGARKLVATTTGTKTSQWEAEIGDFLVTVTRKADKK